jgi:hypothetical protein
VILDRSLKNNPIFHHKQIPESLLTILKRLAVGKFFKNSRQWIVSYGLPRDPWLFQAICSMIHLEKLSLSECKLTLTDLPQLFRSCPKLTELHLMLFDRQNVEMNEELKNELRPGFQRLRLVELKWDINSWQIIQEIFT